MTRQIHKGPGLGLLAVIVVVGMVVGCGIWLIGGLDADTRSIRNYVKIGLIITGIFAWIIHKAMEGARKGPPRQGRKGNRAVPVIDLPPPVPAISAPESVPLPEPTLDFARWMELASALSLRFDPGPPLVLTGEFQSRAVRIKPRPHRVMLELTLAAPVSEELTATVGEDGEMTVETSSHELRSRFCTGDGQVWLTALCNARLSIAGDQVLVSTTGAVADLDVIRGMQEAAAAGARAAEGDRG